MVASAADTVHVEGGVVRWTLRADGWHQNDSFRLAAALQSIGSPSSGDHVMRAPDELTLRLVGVAAALDLPGLGPRVEDAISLALDLLIADRETPATVEVASLGTGATLRDSGDDIRAMLREQAVSPPAPRAGEDAAYTTALWAVGLGGLSVGEFSMVFYHFLPAWSDQSDVQRRLAILLHEWEQESDAEARQPIAATIRQVAAEATRDDPA